MMDHHGDAIHLLQAYTYGGVSLREDDSVCLL